MEREGILALSEKQNEVDIDFRKIAHLGLHGLNEKELIAIYDTAIELSPTTLVEIGGGSGISSVLLASIAKEMGGMLYTVEPYIHLPHWQNWFYNLASHNLLNHVTLISAFSPYIDWTALPFQSIDYLLIDGNHTATAVAADWFMWSKYLSIGGRVAFHDCKRNPKISDVIEQIIDLYPYKVVAHLDTLMGLYIIEKTRKTHNKKHGSPGFWKSCIIHDYRYSLTINFGSILSDSEIGNIVAEFSIISADNSNLKVIGHSRQQVFYRFGQFDSTISTVIDSQRYVMMFSCQFRFLSTKICDFLVRHIEAILGRKVTYNLVPINVI